MMEIFKSNSGLTLHSAKLYSNIHACCLTFFLNLITAYMGVGRGGRGRLAPWILKISAKKVSLLSFE